MNPYDEIKAKQDEIMLALIDWVKNIEKRIAKIEKQVKDKK